MKKHAYYLLPVLLLTLLWLLALPACQKDDPAPTPRDPCPWPEITTVGLNTFACRIDGEQWVPCVDLNGLVVGLRPIDARLTESDGRNSLSISLSRSVYDSMYTNIDANALLTIWLTPCTPGQFEIPGTFALARVGWFPDDSQYGYNNVDTSALNYFRINRLDMEKNIISGQFQITLTDAQTGKKVEITDGRFDLTYNQQ